MKEKAELEEISVQQRSDIHRCRESLQRAVAMDAYFKHRRLALELNVLETKAEPRERAELEAQQEMIFNFLVHSRSSTNTPAVDKFTTLRQEESYGRVKIRGEWQKGFENIYYPKKKQFVEEVMAVIVQRRWRRLLMQKHQRVMLEARMNEMVQLEALNRGALEVSEITERFVQIVKPMEGTLFLRTYLKHDVSRFLHEMCFRISFEEGIQEEEWRNRMLLLWRMRNNYKENVIEVEERTERAKMQRIEFYGGIDKVEIIDDETALRTTLCNERLFFLLRMLIKMERAIRQEVQRTCFISFLDVAEQHSRKALHMEHINSLKESIKTRYIERSSANFKKHQIDGFSEDDDKSQPCDSNNSGSLQESSEALIDSDTPIENTGNSSTNVVQTNDIPETTENEHLNRESEPASISTSTTEEQHAESVDKNKQPHSNCQDNNRSQETLKINPPPTTSEDGMAEDQQEKQAPEEGVAEDQQEKQAPEEGVAEDQQEKQAPEEGVAEDQQEKQAPEEGVAEDQQRTGT
ncbi:unnamed protein product [Trypanosoma congolense IL3000]|uniref:WGS project CAEQ00000000 data, annotated contig 1238 n=1 Tax=Trypanosoma congolense (strain IL3000) TaxID=1068625 RepID=F9W4V7_TRYCI|nr:unnamed protein product [Trypanosoma congolense IL3000]